MKQPTKHKTKWNKKVGRHRCERCGELQLKNEASARAMRKPCPNDLWNEDDDAKE